jgi:hypothetical protein
MVSSYVLGITIVVFVAVAALGIARPSWLLTSLVLSTFWYPAINGVSVSVLKEVAHLPISVYDVAAVSLIVSTLVRAWRFRSLSIGDRSHVMFVCCAAWFGIVGVLRVAVAGGSPGALVRVALWMLVAGLGSSISMTGDLLDRSPRLLAIVIVAAVADLLRRELQQGILHGGYAIGGVVIQKAALSMDSFSFVIALCIGLWWVVSAGWTASRGVLVATALVGVVASLSRSNWLAVAVVMAWLVSQSRGRSRRRLVGILLLVTLAVTLSPLGQLIMSRIGFDAGRQLDGSAQYRTEELRRIPAESLKSVGLLFLGHGTGAWIPDDLAVDLGLSQSWSVHSEWLLVLYDFGAIGVLLYLGLLWTLGRIRRTNGMALRAMVVAWVSVSFTAGAFLTVTSLLWITWLFAGSGAISRAHQAFLRPDLEPARRVAE